MSGFETLRPVDRAGGQVGQPPAQKRLRRIVIIIVDARDSRAGGSRVEARFQPGVVGHFGGRRKGIAPMKLCPLTPLLSSSGFHLDCASLSPGRDPPVSTCRANIGGRPQGETAAIVGPNGPPSAQDRVAENRFGNRGSAEYRNHAPTVAKCFWLMQPFVEFMGWRKHHILRVGIVKEVFIEVGVAAISAPTPMPAVNPVRPRTEYSTARDRTRPRTIGAR